MGKEKNDSQNTKFKTLKKWVLIFILIIVASVVGGIVTLYCYEFNDDFHEWVDDLFDWNVQDDLQKGVKQIKKGFEKTVDSVKDSID